MGIDFGQNFGQLSLSFPTCIALHVHAGLTVRLWADCSTKTAGDDGGRRGKEEEELGPSVVTLTIQRIT
jgi:hypothetical protein